VFIKKKGDRPDVQDIMIIMTDGGSDMPTETVKEAKRAHEAGIR